MLKSLGWAGKCWLGLLAISVIGVGVAPQADAISTFSPVDSMTAVRAAPAAAPLPDGRVLVAGGFYGLWHADAEIFDPSTDSFSAANVGSMALEREGAAAAALADGRVLVAGGAKEDTIYSSAELFDPATKTFSSTGVGSMQTPRERAATAPLSDGRILIAGGTDETALASAEVFDPVTGKFSSTGIGSMAVARTDAAAAPLPDGRVLITGGTNFITQFTSAEVFDPITNSFSSAGLGSMARPRISAAASPLPDGRVLIAGGGSSKGVTTSAEVFDPKTNSFNSVGVTPMSVPRELAAAAPLPGGRVLIAGGYNGSEHGLLDSAEVFVSEPTPTGGSIDFGQKDIGETSEVRSLTITNLGAQALKALSLAVTGPNASDFNLEGNDCQGATIEFEQSCNIEVSFTPSAKETRRGQIEFDSNSSAGPHLFPVLGEGLSTGNEESALARIPVAPSVTPTLLAAAAAPPLEATVRCMPIRTKKFRCTINLTRGSGRIVRFALSRRGNVLATGRPKSVGLLARLSFIRRTPLPPGSYILAAERIDAGRQTVARYPVRVSG